MIYKIDVSRLPEVNLVGRVKYQSGWSHEKTAKRNMLFYVTLGSIRFTLMTGESVVLRRGDCLLLQKGSAYHCTVSEDCDFYYLHFSADAPLAAAPVAEAKAHFETLSRSRLASLSDKYQAPLSEQLYIHSFLSFGEDKALRHIFSDCVHLRYGFAAYDRLSLSVKLVHLLVCLAEKTGREHTDAPSFSGTLARIAAHIERHCTEPLSLADISTHFGLSKQYIMRLFKKQLGLTATQYIHTVKLRRAREMLLMSSLSVSEIAYSLGFHSVYYFDRLFKRHYGCTPGELRIE